MEINEFKKSMEEPNHNSLEELFDKANLSKKERNIYLKYEKSEKWLLRTKVQYSESFESTEINFIKGLAILLINLQSDSVVGAKTQLVNKMFSDKTAHKFIVKKNGVRSKQNSKIVENTYFELEILSFFLKNNFKIKLASDKIIGKKIPEFTAIKDTIKVNVEAKKLDNEVMLDNIFGDRLTYGIDYKFSEKERDKGIRKVLGQFKGSYDKAISKYLETENDYFIIFISSYFRVDYMGKYTVDFINNLSNDWKEKKYERLIGIILPDSNKTYFIKNDICDRNVIKLIEKMGISDFHKYSPELLID